MLQIEPVLKEYLLKTQQHRDEDSKLFIAIKKPYGSIKTVTCRNLFLEAMATADIDIKQFKPHSARSSVTAAPGLTLKEILKLGCWRQESTFRRFYKAKYA